MFSKKYRHFKLVPGPNGLNGVEHGDEIHNHISRVPEILELVEKAAEWTWRLTEEGHGMDLTVAMMGAIYDSLRKRAEADVQALFVKDISSEDADSLIFAAATRS